LDSKGVQGYYSKAQDYMGLTLHSYNLDKKLELSRAEPNLA